MMHGRMALRSTSTIKPVFGGFLATGFVTTYAVAQEKVEEPKQTVEPIVPEEEPPKKTGPSEDLFKTLEPSEIGPTLKKLTNKFIYLKLGGESEEEIEQAENTCEFLTGMGKLDVQAY